MAGTVETTRHVVKRQFDISVHWRIKHASSTDISLGIDSFVIGTTIHINYNTNSKKPQSLLGICVCGEFSHSLVSAAIGLSKTFINWLASMICSIASLFEEVILA